MVYKKGKSTASCVFFNYIRGAITFVILLAAPLFAEDEGHGNIVGSVGIAILAATIIGFLAHKLKQPLLLAYIVAGIAITLLWDSDL